MMAVKLRDLEVNELGPLTRFAFEFGNLNVIYGQNERGKTYLVEFVIRSLFRNAKLWPLRDEQGRGRITVDGLEEDGVTFDPGSSKKLEDFWEESNTGMPADFSKLLVVKGAEVELANVDGGVDKAIIKRLLSSKEILDKIEKKISKTIQEAQFQDGAISGPKRGEIAQRLTLREEYEKLNQLFDRIEREYTGGPRRALSEQMEKLETEIEQQLHAQRHLAYTIDKEIRKLKEKRNQIAAEKVQAARHKLNLYRQKVAEYRKKQDDQQDAEARSKHYEWLNGAQTIYQNSLKEEIEEPKPVFMILAGVSVLAAAVLAFLSLPIFAALALVGVIVFGWLSIQKYRTLASHAAEKTELEKLQSEFQQLFGTKLTGLPLLLELKKNLEEDYNNAHLLKKQLSEDLKELYSLKVEISALIRELTGEDVDPQQWNEILRKTEDEQQKLDNDIRDKELHLAKLGVDSSDFRSDRPRTEYSRLRLEGLENTLANAESKIEAETQKLTSLKQIICEHTGEDISASWETLIERLREKRDKVLGAYQQKTAEIVGKLAVFNVLNELRQAEDSKIATGLASPEVQEPLLQLTGRYHSVSLKSDGLMVSNSGDSFRVSELSTGAREQVLLALRIGFARKILGREHLFLILDDAFQYSDWERRKLLVDAVSALASEGWQIIYFTMDDHIRDLFREKASVFGDTYRYAELGRQVV